MTIDKVHKLIKDICRKQDVSFPEDSVIDAYLHQQQMAMMTDFLRQYGLGQLTKDALDPFKKFKDFTYATSVGGVVTYPNDYLHLCGGSFVRVHNNKLDKTFTYNINFPNEDSFNDALDCSVRVVSKSYPLAMAFGTYLQLYPKEPQLGRIYYFKKPNEPKMAYTLLGRVLTYDSANSVQLEWSDTYIRMLILMVLDYMGITYGEKDLIQFASDKKEA